LRTGASCGPDCVQFQSKGQVVNTPSSSNGDADRVLVSVADGIADVRLNRPDKLNALDHAMFRALADTAARLSTDRSVRVVVLSGEGRSFCAGLDFSNFESMAKQPPNATNAGAAQDSAAQDSAAQDSATQDSAAQDSATQDSAAVPVPIDLSAGGRITHLGQQAVWGWQEMPQPVICAVTGHALGGGLQLALGGDIRIVHPEAKLSVLEMRWGLIPDMCASELLPRLVGVDVAKELYFTGRMFDGAEANALGIATSVSADTHADAMALAAEIARQSPDAMRRAKSLINQFGRVDTATAFANERRLMTELIGSPNQVEAVTAFFEKRQPDFADEGY